MFSAKAAPTKAAVVFWRTFAAKMVGSPAPCALKLRSVRRLPTPGLLSAQDSLAQSASSTYVQVHSHVHLLESFAFNKLVHWTTISSGPNHMHDSFTLSVVHESCLASP